MQVTSVTAVVARPLESSQRRARRNARLATQQVLARRAEREDVETFFSKVLPQQRQAARIR